MNNNFKQRFLAFSLAISMLLTSSCGKNKNDANGQNTNSANSSLGNLDEEQSTNPIISGEQIESEQKQLEIAGYQEFFANFRPNYKYEIPIPEEIIDTIINYNDKKVPCQYNFDGDYNKVIEQIKQNSKEFINKYPEFNYCFSEDNFGLTIDNFAEVCEEQIVNVQMEPNTKTQLFMEIALEYTLAIYKETATNNINDDIHQMNNLVVVVGDPMQFYDNVYLNDKVKITSDYDEAVVLGIYDGDQNVIIVNAGAILLNYDYSYSHLQKQLNSLITVLIHEFNHMREHSCECRYQNGDVDTTWYYNNPFISSYDEAAAESEIYNLNKDPEQILPANPDDNKKVNLYYSYPTLRDSESLLLLLGITQDNIPIDNYYNAVFDTDLAKLFKFFGAQTREDVERIFGIAYLIDGINGRNDFGWKLLGYDDTNVPINHQDLQNAIGFSYKTDLLALILKNLVNYTETHPDFSWKENLATYNIIRNLIIDDFDDPNIDEEERNNFAKDIVQLNENYLKYIACKYDLTYDEVEMYCNGAENSLILLNAMSKYYFLDDEDVYYEDTINNLTTRFPLLKNILFTNLLISTNFQELQDYVNQKQDQELTLTIS